VKSEKLETIKGQPPSITDKISGCPYHPRCKDKMNMCPKAEPRLEKINNNSETACYLY